jgi:predicted kinase
MVKEKPAMKDQEREDVSRRKFVRQTAEVAAMSLFGMVGLDVVIDSVVRRLDERRRIDRLARRAAEHLRVERPAYGEECSG